MKVIYVALFPWTNTEPDVYASDPLDKIESLPKCSKALRLEVCLTLVQRYLYLCYI